MRPIVKNWRTSRPCGRPGRSTWTRPRGCTASSRIRAARSSSSRGRTAQEALDQIRAKGYSEPCLADGRPVHLIGLGFDTATRHLVDAVVETAEALA